MAYTRVNWQNSPSHATPLSAENLNVMDAAIASLDTAVTEAAGDISTLETSVEDNTSDISDLKEDLEHISGISDDVKVALLQIASKVAYIDDDGQDYYDDLYDALYPPKEVVSISAVYTQSGTVYDTDSLDSLKTDLVVTATYDDQTSGTVIGYTLSGTLSEGTSIITVEYEGKTTSFSVTVTTSRIFVSHLATDYGTSYPSAYKVNYGASRPRTFIGSSIGGYPIAHTSSSQDTSIVVYPIPLGNITSIKITSIGSFELSILKYDIDHWNVYKSDYWIESGTTMDVSAYTNKGYYFSAVIASPNAVETNTTIEVTRG